MQTHIPLAASLTPLPQITWHPSPNYNNRLLPLTMIILHYTGMKTAQAALKRLCDPQAEVSCHYFITRDGNIFQLVKEDKRSWHAGHSYWQGIKDINSASIGIELENKGHEHGYEDFSDVQIKNLILLLKDTQKRHNILPKNIIGHSDIAPMRKKDPGEKFPWAVLMREGITPNIPKHKIKAAYRLRPLNAAQFAKEAINHLSKIGYDTQPVSFWSAKNSAALRAFCRHYVPFPKTQESIRIMYHKVLHLMR